MTVIHIFLNAKKILYDNPPPVGPRQDGIPSCRIIEGDIFVTASNISNRKQSEYLQLLIRILQLGKPFHSKIDDFLPLPFLRSIIGKRDCRLYICVFWHRFTVKYSHNMTLSRKFICFGMSTLSFYSLVSLA